jgi:hypothetical protein
MRGLRNGSERKGGGNEAETRKGCLFSLVQLWGHGNGCSEIGRESVCLFFGRAGFLGEDSALGQSR